MAKYITQKGLDKIKKELEKLKTIGRKEVANRLKYAASFGDFSENAAYDEAKESKAFLEGKILELTDIVRKSEIITKKEHSNVVQIGSIVLLNIKGGKEKFEIVGAEESDPVKGKISYQSPLGKALLGKAVGETAIVHAPAGETRYKILKID